MNLSLLPSHILICSILFAHWSHAQEMNDAWIPTIEAPQYFAIFVSDVDEAVTWYMQAFDLEPTAGSQADDGSWRIENLVSSSLQIELIYDERAVEVERGLGFVKVGFSVPDVDQIANRIQQFGNDRPRIVEFAELNQRILQIRDPDGNVIQLTSPISR